MCNQLLFISEQVFCSFSNCLLDSQTGSSVKLVQLSLTAKSTAFSESQTLQLQLLMHYDTGSTL